MIADCIESLKQHGVPDVMLWLVELDSYARHATLEGLSADEHARAAHMLERVGARYLAARHALRTVLGEVLNCPAASLVIKPDAFGKPRVMRDESVDFNLSHSAHLCMIGVSLRQPIGVDIEVLRAMSDADRLAQTHFTDNEQREWSQTRSDRDFLRCWTRKEACLKALGVGLSVPPASIDAGCAARVRKLSLPVGDHGASVEVRSIDNEPEHVSAVALAMSEDAILVRRSWAS